MSQVSNCCGAPFHEPGWPDTDICSACHEHCEMEETDEPEDYIGDQTYASVRATSDPANPDCHRRAP